MEAASFEEVLKPADGNNLLWYGKVDSETTTLWAQFINADPNRETVEINVRQTIFIPISPLLILLLFQDLRCNTRRQTGATYRRTNGSYRDTLERGWIIENNVVQYSKCVGYRLENTGMSLIIKTLNLQ